MKLSQKLLLNRIERTELVSVGVNPFWELVNLCSDEAFSKSFVEPLWTARISELRRETLLRISELVFRWSFLKIFEPLWTARISLVSFGVKPFCDLVNLCSDEAFSKSFVEPLWTDRISELGRYTLLWIIAFVLRWSFVNICASVA